MQNKNTISIVLVILVIIGISYKFIKINNSGSNYLSSTASSTNTTDISTPTTDNNKVNVTNKNTTTVNSGTVTTNAIKIGQRVPYNGIYITPMQISYDGRCPIDVKCTQSGSFFDLGVTLENGITKQSIIISLNKPFTFVGKNITLTSVSPAKNSRKALVPSDYSFTFKVTN